MSESATPTALRLRTESAERVAVNATWLVRLRWAAVIGQCFTVVAADRALEVLLPLESLFAIMTVACMTNVVFGYWIKGRIVSGGGRLDEGHPEWLIGSIMAIDVVFLTALLFLTGGAANPFAIFYLVNVVLAAVVLNVRWAVFLNLQAIVCYTFLNFSHRSLELQDDVQMKGTTVALVAAAGIIVYFVNHVNRELAHREDQLVRVRERKAASDRLGALATLAGGAAHELSSPLSTIAIVARDLELALKEEGSATETVEDARLIRREVGRCRAILDQMSVDAGQSKGEELVLTPVEDLIKTALETIHSVDHVEVSVSARAREVLLRVPYRAVSQSIRALIKNALDASEEVEKVRVLGDITGEFMEVTVIDNGQGMASDVLGRSGEPFFTTKEPGRGMGLGLFLTRTVAERLGGRLDLISQSGHGTRARLLLPIQENDQGVGDD